MRRLLLAGAVLALLLPGSAQAKWWPLHLYSYGPHVKDAQWLMKGNNRLYPGKLRTYGGRIDGHYGRSTARATRRTKYLLGYAIQDLNGTFGWRLYAQLTGHERLSGLALLRRARRLKFLRQPRRGVVAQSPRCAGYYAPKPHVLVFARLVSARYGHPLVCVSGYRPGSVVYGSGRISMHASGNAGDLGTPTYAMNTAVGHAALEAAGMSRAQAARYSSFAGWYGGVNILFHTYIGGNHYNHVHVGLWSWPTRRIGFNAFTAEESMHLYARLYSLNTEDLGAWNVFYRFGLSATPTSALGYAIVAVKRELAYDGFADGLDLDTSYFGGAAAREARLFQEANGLTADGVVGPRTARVLFRRRAEATALANGIPDHLVARQDGWESADDPAAIGPGGDDYGLPQWNLPSHPDLTRAQAISPAYSLPRQGVSLRGSYAQLHDWDGALCAWNAGLSLATRWVAAGKPPSGGPINHLGQDLYTVCTNYVARVRATPW